MLAINIPIASWSSQDITLAGQTYTFVFDYNTRDERWRMSLYQDDAAIIEGLKIISNEVLNAAYVLKEFNHGALLCVKTSKVEGGATRNTLGVDLPFEIRYVSLEEIQQALEG